MIDKVFSTIITDNLTPYFNKKLSPIPPDGIWIYPCNASEITDPASHVPNGVLTMSLVNIEEDRFFNSNSTYIRQNQPLKFTSTKPPVYVNLYILFASNALNGTSGKPGENYLDGLNRISYLIQFFQQKNVFNPQNSPLLADSGIEDLIFDLKTLSFQDLNNLWGVLGSKYLPSALYKVRMLCIKEDYSQDAVPFISNVTINESVIKQ